MSFRRTIGENSKIKQHAQPSYTENTSANDEANTQGIAAKRLAEDVNLAGVVMTVTDARVVLNYISEAGMASLSFGIQDGRLLLKAKVEELLMAIQRRAT